MHKDVPVDPEQAEVGMPLDKLALAVVCSKLQELVLRWIIRGMVNPAVLPRLEPLADLRTEASLGEDFLAR